MLVETDAISTSFMSPISSITSTPYVYPVDKLKNIDGESHSILFKTSVKNDVWSNYFGKNSTNGYCFICKTNICRDNMNTDSFKCAYYISRKNGGSTHINNMRPLCICCHTLLDDKGIEEILYPIIPTSMTTTMLLTEPINTIQPSNENMNNSTNDNAMIVEKDFFQFQPTNDYSFDIIESMDI